MNRVAKAPLDMDLSELSYWLHIRGVPHRVIEEGGEQVILMPDDRFESDIQSVLQRYISEPDFRISIHEELSRYHPRERKVVVAYERALPSQAPIIYAFIILSVVVAYLTNLGDGGPLLRSLLIVNPFDYDGDLASIDGRISGLYATLAGGQIWRLVTPDFLHFSLLHITFNLLMLWILGGQLEIRRGSFSFLSLAVFVSIVSNVAQFLDTGYLFGGMSGVVYGLVGYCWVWRKFNNEVFMPDVLFRFCIIWLIIGYTPITEWAGLGRMANSAHLYGLISGLVWGAITMLGSGKNPSQAK